MGSRRNPFLLTVPTYHYHLFQIPDHNRSLLVQHAGTALTVNTQTEQTSAGCQLSRSQGDDPHRAPNLFQDSQIQESLGFVHDMQGGQHMRPVGWMCNGQPLASLVGVAGWCQVVVPGHFSAACASYAT